MIKTMSGTLQAPHIIAGHIDGPLLVYSDGQMHWLTWQERFAVAFGFSNAATIQAKRRPILSQSQEGKHP